MMGFGTPDNMSAAVSGFAGGPRVLRFWTTTIGKKAVMAVSGIVLAGFVLGHLIGNLQIFLGPEQFNGYARTLRHLPELVWPTRVTLLVMVLLHIWSSLQLAVTKSEARPQNYVKRRSAGSSYASRTMYMSGPIIAAFIIYHLMQFTFGVGGTPYHEFDAYGNVIQGFRVPAVSIFYIIAMALLCLHLRHGLWSLFQSLGFYHPRHTAKIKRLASLVSLFVFFGFISIPVAVMLRVITVIL
jgi:succinate dehydrogenase / fumarate reductase cytochrome b subunit